ncbi:alpha/beta fold hydrolase [Amnibacterium endophyticum]|uniref:Alpha/beta fold hydrolase n=1 Tax=Amnibacterium endophyticum TaxID=2109337 RepID=A0ABW4LCN0_9MICO
MVGSWSGRRRALAVVVAALVVAAIGVAAAVVVPRLTGPARPALAAPVARFVSVPESPTSTQRIRLDTSLYLPATRPAPAVLLAHAFGQDKGDLAGEARRLQREGYAVLTYSARGFGASGGRIGLDSLDGEVPDARALIDVLDARRDVLHRDGDPVVAVVGASYGGALALMAGATDPRVDAVVAGITWYDLGQALVPWTSGWARGVEPERTVKAAWLARLFGTAAADDAAGPCARFTPQVCALYRTLVTGGPFTAADQALLERSSPESVLGGMTAPTLLLQGLNDSLFTLRQADLNAGAIRRAGAPVQVQWFAGGHDGGGTAGTEQAVDDFLDARLRHPQEPVSTRFTYTVPAGATSFEEQHSTGRYPGLDARDAEVLPLDGGERTVVNPPGGQPASVTSLPGIGAATDLGRTASGLLSRTNPPNQAARFVSEPLTSSVVLTGAAQASVDITTTSAQPQDVVLFAQLTAVTGSQRRPLPGGVAPVHVRLPPGGARIRVWLPGTVWRFAPGDRVELTLRTTDSQFLGSTEPATYRLSADAVALPRLGSAPSAGTVFRPTRGQLDRIALLALLIAALLAAALIGGRVRTAAARRAEARGQVDDAPPLLVRGLTKRFRSGFTAVDDAAFTVERGQVVGLLGENGAGKTTTMRMVLGLTRPDAGSIEAFGVPVVPGSPVLRRVGAFVEGPGFLPHLSGRRNLRLHWAATGRPAREARLGEALAVADLGGAIRRRVGGYSQGMRQRLAIAQAMLGMPDLLVLDEPTNGLDPTQIVALRDVLRRYAEGGRTVVVSSHLLGEVEQTCSHVVVMSHGRVIAAGPVEEIAGGAEQVVVEVGDVDAAVAALTGAGARAVDGGGGTVRVEGGALGTAEVVALLVGAGVALTGLRRERRLEDAFLDLIAEPEPA